MINYKNFKVYNLNDYLPTQITLTVYLMYYITLYNGIIYGNNLSYVIYIP